MIDSFGCRLLVGAFAVPVCRCKRKRRMSSSSKETIKYIARLDSRPYVCSLDVCE